MPHYIFICHSGDDDDVIVLARVEQELEDDLDALESAERLAERCAFDVWADERLVAKVKRGNEPLNAMDRHSG